MYKTKRGILKDFQCAQCGFGFPIRFKLIIKELKGEICFLFCSYKCLGKFLKANSLDLVGKELKIEGNIDDNEIKNLKKQCVYCYRILIPDYVLIIKEEYNENDCKYKKLFFCSKDCLNAYLQTDPFRFIGKEARLEKWEDET